MTQPMHSDKGEVAGLNPLLDDKELEDQDGPESSTVDSGGGPNQSDDPAPDESPEDERP